MLLAPQLRRRLREEVILVGSLLVPGLVALLSARDATKFGITLTAAALAFGSAAGKVAFDSLVQRDGPEELYGRAFARFETRFQLTWVAGALIPVALLDVMDSRMGLFVLAITLGFAGLSYFGGMRSVRYAPREPRALPPGHPDDRAARAAGRGQLARLSSGRRRTPRWPGEEVEVRRERPVAGSRSRADDRVVEALTMIDRPSQSLTWAGSTVRWPFPPRPPRRRSATTRDSARRSRPGDRASWSSMRESVVGRPKTSTRAGYMVSSS